MLINCHGINRLMTAKVAAYCDHPALHPLPSPQRERVKRCVEPTPTLLKCINTRCDPSILACVTPVLVTCCFARRAPLLLCFALLLCSGLQMKKIIYVEGLHNAFFVVAVVGTIFTLVSLVAQFYATFDFVILKIDRICEQPLNNRCVDHYLVKRKDGGYETLTPSAYKFRESELVTGNSLKKNRFALRYEVNGRSVRWDYFTLHVMGIGLSGLIFVWWQYLSRKLGSMNAG